LGCRAKGHDRAPTDGAGEVKQRATTGIVESRRTKPGGVPLEEDQRQGEATVEDTVSNASHSCAVKDRFPSRVDLVAGKAAAGAQLEKMRVAEWEIAAQRSKISATLVPSPDLSNSDR
jgi:hypothetical protein